jgi:hypothetical protein
MFNLCKLKNSNIKNLEYSNKNKIIERFLNLFKITKIGYIKIKNKKYIIKKELFLNNYFLIKFIYNLINFEVSEYNFYKYYKNKIIKYKFNKNIQIPIEYNICKNFNIYLFKILDFDLNNKFLNKLNKKNFNNILNQIIMIIYFINHKLNIFHNDISNINNLRNFMINKINNSYNLVLDNKKIKVKNYQLILIDFGLYNKTIGFKTIFFYNKQTIKYFYNFNIKSELFLVYYLLLINYNKKINFKKLYLQFYNKINICNNDKINLKNFDKYIFQTLL